MMEKFFILLPVLIIGTLFLTATSGLAKSESSISEKAQKEKDLEVHFFYSETCPHCGKEGEFLDKMEGKYGSSLKIDRYLISDSEHQELLFDLAEKAWSER